MTVLEFAEILGTQLLRNNLDDLDVYKNDPDQLPYLEQKIDLIYINKYDPNDFKKKLQLLQYKITTSISQK